MGDPFGFLINSWEVRDFSFLLNDCALLIYSFLPSLSSSSPVIFPDTKISKEIFLKFFFGIRPYTSEFLNYDPSGIWKDG